MLKPIILMLLILVVISTEDMVMKANKKNAKESEKKEESKESTAKKDDKKKKKNISEMKKPITVSGKVNVTKNCMFGEIISSGGIELEAKVLKTKLLKVGTLQAKHQGRPLVMNGSIAVYKMKTQEKTQKILLQEIQWELLHHLDFSDQPHDVNQKCENLRDGNFLGGYCNDHNQTLSKKFQNIPPHTSIKIQLSLHVFDQWDSEQILLYADKQIVWRSKFDNTMHHQNLCGNSRYGDQINIPVMKIFEHNSTDLLLQFQALTPKSTCEASFAIDNLIISIK
ncbi:hypothetical protein pb186bvf_008212 [Paramecium bursaria]